MAIADDTAVPVVRYTVTVRVEIANRPGMLGRVATAIGELGGDIGAVDLVDRGGRAVVRDFTVSVQDSEHARDLVAALNRIPGVRVRAASDEVFLAHLGGKIEVHNRIPVKSRRDLSLVYTPGVARVSLALARDPHLARMLSVKRNSLAVVSDGSAVLGLGDIGPYGALPVMEGKAMLFKQFGQIDAWPIVLDVHTPDEIVAAVKAIAPGFGAINLEDIAAPKCFEVEQRLIEELDIPVMHDDQHGTAIVALAATINALQVVGKKLEDLRIVVLGAGAAGFACTRILQRAGARDIIVLDRHGALHPDRPAIHDRGPKEWLATHTNPGHLSGSLVDVLPGADMFLGVSGPNLLPPEAIPTMARDPIVFALANPDPEVDPLAAAKYATVVATGRSDYANQINNVLAFPGVFRGVLDVGAPRISEEMKIAAARALAEVVPRRELGPDYIIPSVFNPAVARSVARAVARQAGKEGLALLRRARRATIHYL